MLTYEPLFAVLPSSGLCEITVPSCAEDAFLETLPRFNPFALSVASACSLPKPIMLGTDTLSAAGVACALLSPLPLLTWIFIISSLLSFVPPKGV